MWRGLKSSSKDATRVTPGPYTSASAGSAPRYTPKPRSAEEDALQLEIPPNAHFIRNLIVGGHGIHDHIVHFYHLCALDWVDIVSATRADPVATAALGQKLSDWKGNSVQEIRAVQERLKKFIGSGQLGIFASGYWPSGDELTRRSTSCRHPLSASPGDISARSTCGRTFRQHDPHPDPGVGGVNNPSIRQPANQKRKETVTNQTLIEEVGDFINQACSPTWPPSAPIMPTGPNIAPSCSPTVPCPTCPWTVGHQLPPARRLHSAGDIAGSRQQEPRTSALQVDQGIDQAIMVQRLLGRSPYEEDTVPKYTALPTKLNIMVQVPDLNGPARQGRSIGPRGGHVPLRS
jgi:hydrogenase large subunit